MKIGQLVLISLAFVVQTQADELTKSAKIAKAYEALEGWNETVENAMKEHAPSGFSMAVIVEGEVILSKGYGVANEEANMVMSSESLMPLGTLTQSFTSTLLGCGKEKGWFEWDQPIISHLPNFRLADVQMTYKTTLRDLMCHRTGLPSYDLLWVGSTLTRDEMLEKMHLLQPTEEFRAHYQNHNVMMLPLAAILEKHSTVSFEQLMQSTLLQPIGMTDSTFTPPKEKMALGYEFQDGALRLVKHPDLTPVRPSLGLFSTLTDMTKWLQFQITTGKVKEASLLKKETLQELHTGQMVLHAKKGSYPNSNTIINRVVGLGWFSESYQGHYHVHHEAHIDGYSHVVSFLPFDNIGIVILSNHHQSALPKALSYTLLDKLLNAQGENWLEALNVEPPKKETNTAKAPSSHAMEEYVGTYFNEALGEIKISIVDDMLVASYRNMQIPLKHAHFDVFTSADEKTLKVLQDCRFAFSNNAEGQVKKLSIPMSHSKDEITFERKVESK